MYLSYLSALLFALPAAHAVFQDEVGEIDYHYELLGVPQPGTTFFHKPRADDKASLLYTLSDVGVLGAVNPSSGAVVWRQLLNSTGGGGGHLRAAENQGWVCSAIGSTVQAWGAVNGRNAWSRTFAGEVRDLEIMEMTEVAGRKDVLALFEEAGGATVLRRMDGNEGDVAWEFRQTSKDVPLQVSNSIDKVFVVSLHGSPGSYSLKVSVLDPATGARLDDLVISTKGDVRSANDVMFVGANSASPIVAWTDSSSLSTLKVNVLGTKNRQEIALGSDTVGVAIHAPHLIQSQPHFLIHSRTSTGNRAEVYHIDMKSSAVTKAYDLPHLPGQGSFSTSSSGANTYFTRITEDEITVTASISHGILGRWPVKAGDSEAEVYQSVSEVLSKADGAFAVQSAGVSGVDDWIMLRNGRLEWSRPEGMSGAVAAAWAEIPESEEFASILEAEAHSNPLQAYIHRVQRHLSDLQYLPDYLRSIPERLISSILGTDMAASEGLTRDSFGFHKLVILATRRGRLYGLDAGNHGKVLWTIKAADVPAGHGWDVKGMLVDDSAGSVEVRGADGESIIVKTDTGKTLESKPAGSSPAVSSTVLADSPSGKKWLLAIGADGKVGDLPSAWAPKQTLVVQGDGGELRGLKFIPKGEQSVGEVTWVFSPPTTQKVVSVASRLPHDPVASIGRVLGDRSVQYKYLNPNTIVVAAADETASTLTVYLLDTVSGQILTSTTHKGVDADKPVTCAISENWFVCSFFGQYALADSPTQSIKGYQVVISDLYESDTPNDRGPLGDAANFSSLNPVDLPTGPPLPSVVSQSYVLAAPVSAFEVTQTRQGITSRAVLAFLPEAHSIALMPRIVLEPRRPVGRDPTPAELEEGLIKYAPNFEIDPKHVITHQRDVVGVRRIMAAPALVESTSLVFAYGIDVFGTRIAPSMVFDILGKSFNKVTLIGTVVALSLGVAALAPMVRRKQINMMWQAPM